jgi:hypothetical protein
MGHVPAFLHGSYKVSRNPCPYSFSYTHSIVLSIANAKVSGMEVDLNLTSNEYSVALVVYFVGYVVFEVPSK